MSRYLLAAVTLSSLVSPAPAQSPDVDPVVVESVDDEIRLARSAAPSHVSADATILVLKDRRFEMAVEGTSAVTCLVARSRPGSLEPICYDGEGSRTILPIEVRRNELRFAGTPEEEIDRMIAEAIGRGELRLPARPAMSYMMSSGQMLVSEDGRAVGAWLPHLMLYVPYITAEQLGLYGAPSPRAAMVFEEGTPTAHVVIVVREFVDP